MEWGKKKHIDEKTRDTSGIMSRPMCIQVE